MNARPQEEPFWGAPGGSGTREHESHSFTFLAIGWKWSRIPTPAKAMSRGAGGYNERDPLGTGLPGKPGKPSKSPTGHPFPAPSKNPPQTHGHFATTPYITSSTSPFPVLRSEEPICRCHPALSISVNTGDIIAKVSAAWLLQLTTQGLPGYCSHHLW